MAKIKTKEFHMKLTDGSLKGMTRYYYTLVGGKERFSSTVDLPVGAEYVKPKSQLGDRVTSKTV